MNHLSTSNRLFVCCLIYKVRARIRHTRTRTLVTMYMLVYGAYDLNAVDGILNCSPSFSETSRYRTLCAPFKGNHWTGTKKEENQTKWVKLFPTYKMIRFRFFFSISSPQCFSFAHCVVMLKTFLLYVCMCSIA